MDPSHIRDQAMISFRQSGTFCNPLLFKKEKKGKEKKEKEEIILHL